ncbi:Beta-lactamase enzyme family protein [Thermomonospora echinospora]|uniref:Beta-lactamase enzyme family protein n=1 Tax=Thermomonospora echinospora TaxID=1992 RepID=A0A1H6C857_9ACTN|nr:Beta-lactamase enzyme family protein [Thermomonospora echinospora]
MNGRARGRGGRLAVLTAGLVIALLAGVLVPWPSHGYEDAVSAAPTGLVPLEESRSAALTRSVAGYLAGREGGRLSVEVRDLATGTFYAYGSSQRFPTASIVKADILAALLLQAQQARRDLTEEERELAARMIRKSDNASATTLWNAIGGAPGLTRANQTLGLTETTPASGGYWGLTSTSAHDQVRLLSVLAAGDGPLDARSRAYALSLMSSVSAGQDWGVSAAAPGSPVALKNGWLPRTADDGRWVVNSIGRVRTGTHDYLIAVLSDRSPSLKKGITTVEHVTKLVTRSLP